MTPAYGLRLICLCLAVFYLVEAAVAVAVALSARWAVLRAERMPAGTAARLLIGLRLLPAAAGYFAAVGLCAPSYLRFEPDATGERIGLFCVTAAAAGAALVAAGVVRAMRAAVRSARCLRSLDGHALLTAGILRSRVVVAGGVRDRLSREEFEAAVRHEYAHASSRDNLKRLLIALAPAPVPATRSFAALERAWRRMAEWAADDVAAAGSADRGVALASALVRVARMGPARAPELATSLLADGEELAERVERLLRGPAAVPPPPRLWPIPVALAGVVPFVLPAVHRMVERLAG